MRQGVWRPAARPPRRAGLVFLTTAALIAGATRVESEGDDRPRPRGHPIKEVASSRVTITPYSDGTMVERLVNVAFALAKLADGRGRQTLLIRQEVELQPAILGEGWDVEIVHLTSTATERGGQKTRALPRRGAGSGGAAIRRRSVDDHSPRLLRHQAWLRIL